MPLGFARAWLGAGHRRWRAGRGLHGTGRVRTDEGTGWRCDCKYCCHAIPEPIAGGPVCYAVANGAMATLSRQITADLGKYNIRANCTRIGWQWSEPVRQAVRRAVAGTGGTGEEFIAGVASRIPLGVVPPEDECARSVLMFVSDYKNGERRSS